MAAAAEIGDLIEVRLDCLDPLQLGEHFKNGEHLFDSSPLPAILTFRPADQGGLRQLDTKSRLFFGCSIVRLHPRFLISNWTLL